MLSAFLKSIFGKPAKIQSYTDSKQNMSLTQEELQNVSFADLLSLLRTQNASSMPYDNVAAVTRRLYRIALFDNHVPKADREAALSLADALTEDLAAMLANQSYTLAALRAIKPRMLDLARQGGCGSLIWRIGEFSISPADTIPYIMRPEHRHLVHDYFDALPQLLASYKHLFVRELILQSNYKSRMRY